MNDISTGSTVGPYVVEALIARGQTADTFRAEDTRLKRQVALRVLPSHLAKDRALVERFMLEASLAASLSHPNVLVVHDIGEQYGRPYVVSELLEGSTLRARLSRGALPLEAAIRHAIGLTEGLAAAHRHGVVPCALQPESVFVTHDDRVKILDFGGARNFAAAGSAPYASPEYACGARADARADIFRLGVIFYEMVTGITPFGRLSVVDTLNAVLNDDPVPLTRHDERISGAFQAVVWHCLEKNPDARFQSAGDLLFILKLLRPAVAVRRRFRRVRPLAWTESTVGAAAARLRQIASGHTKGATDYLWGHRAGA